MKKETSLVCTMSDDVLSGLILKDSALKFDLNYLKISAKKYENIPQELFVDFLHKAQLTGADPRLNQIYLIAYKKSYKDDAGNWQSEFDASVVYNYLFLIQKAEETNKLDGFESGTKYNEKKELLGWAKVYRKDWTHPVYVECKLSEFIKKNKTGEIQGQWKNMPEYLLEKCALANAIRRAFPNLSSIYIQEEMIQSNEPINVTPQEKETKQKEEPKQENKSETTKEKKTEQKKKTVYELTADKIEKVKELTNLNQARIFINDCNEFTDKQKTELLYKCDLQEQEITKPEGETK